MNRISINKLESTLIKDNVMIIPFEGFSDIEIMIKKVIPLSDVIQFVENVAGMCVDMDTGDYLPQVKDFAIKGEILTRYANFTLPDNIDKKYTLIYGTTAVRQVMRHINLNQLNEITDSIDKKIDFLLTLLTNTQAAKMIEMTNKINDVVSQSETVLGNISEKDILNLMKNVGSLEKLNEEKLVSAVFEAQKADA